MIDLVVLDVGNSAVKVALFAGDDLVERAAFAHDDPAAPRALREAIARAPADAPVAAAAVRPARLAPILAALDPARPRRVAPGDFLPPIENDADVPANVGLDRLFNAAAVAGAARPTVVVDAGTAVTIDRVEPPGVFRGGTIGPGLRLGFEALHRETERLPRVDLPAPGEEVRALGRDTVPAIRAGVVLGVAGAIERIARELGAGRDADVVLTGGDAAHLRPFLGLELRLDPDLTLRGIARGARSAAPEGA